MKNIKGYCEYITEMKSERKIVQDLARHLAFDRDVIKYLNTSRAKRTMGWRELLQTKLRGKQLDYINYITKNMVADYNPQITGYLHIESEGDNEERKDVLKRRGNNLDITDVVNNITDRVEDIEDVLGIDPTKKETLDNVVDKLKEVGYEPTWIDAEIDDAEEE